MKLESHILLNPYFDAVRTMFQLMLINHFSIDALQFLISEETQNV